MILNSLELLWFLKHVIIIILWIRYMRCYSVLLKVQFKVVKQTI
jgi:hypothetical protein